MLARSHRAAFVSVLVAILAAALLAAQASGARRDGIAFSPCAADSPTFCGQISAPLDPAGVVPGSVSLYVQELQPEGTPKGVIFLLAGGPGQAATNTFLLVKHYEFWRELLPGYTLVEFDDRGSGRSSPIDSRPAALPFYSTRDNAADIDAVRQALGVDQILLNGTSYGTQLALSYASYYPSHVAGLVLDSTVPPTGRDPYELNMWRSMPSGLAALCAAATCSDATTNFPRDVAALANQLAKKPLNGLASWAGKKVKASISGMEFLSIVIDSDLDPGIAAELPATVAAARQGYASPLLHLLTIVAIQAIDPDLFGIDLSLFQATVCNDGPFPWSASTPMSQRAALVNASVAALPPGATGPFGSWVTGMGVAVLCETWPVKAAGPPAIDSATLPDVPVLILSGDEDLRTPTADAFAVAKLFPHAQVTIAHGQGHAVQGVDQNSCPDLAVKTWLAGGTAPSDCPRIAPPVLPLPRLAPTASGLTAQKTPRARTLAAVLATVRDASAVEVSLQYSPYARKHGAPGIAGGLLFPKKDSAALLFSLESYALVPGFALSGSLALQPVPGSSLLPTGTVVVGGAQAAAARVTFDAGGAHVAWLSK